LTTLTIFDATTAFGQVPIPVNVSIVAGAGSSASAPCVAANNCFSPNPISVAPGTPVTWTNNDQLSHTITSGKVSDSNAGSLFDSGLVKPGKTFQFTFANVGAYNYFCTVHPWMIGEVDVGGVAAVLTPTITNPINGTTINSPNMEVRGISIPYYIIQVFENGTNSGTTIANNAGNWSLSTTLLSGTNVLAAKAIDFLGISFSSSNVIIHANILPQPPTITTGNGTSESILNPTINGISQPNSGIILFDGSNSIGSTTSDNNGGWSLTIQFSPGPHTLTAKTTTSSGISPASRSVTIIVGVPSPPQIIYPSSTIVNTLRPTIIGTSNANASIQIFTTGNNETSDCTKGTLIGSTTASTVGTWSVTTSTLSVGNQFIILTASNNIGTSDAFCSRLTIILPSSSITLNPSSGQIGINDTITGINFAGNSVVKIVYDTTNVTPIGGVTTNSSGSFLAKVIIPASTPGSHTVVATDVVNNSASTIFTVIPSSTAYCSPPTSGDWVVSSTCTLSTNATAPANIIVNNGAILTIPNGIRLNIDMVHHHLLVQSGGGVLVQSGGTIN